MDFFSILPSEIIIVIVSRHNVGDILRCKRVCKSWLHLVRTDHFVRSHLSRSVPGHFVRFIEPVYCENFEFKEGNEYQFSMTNPNTGSFDMDKLHFNSVMKLNMPFCEGTNLDICSSVNGLLLLVKTEIISYELYETNYICNPITREYINICSRFGRLRDEFVGYGFGVSKLSKHTVLRVRHKISGEKHINCDVYTLGSGSWRSVASPDPFLCCDANFPMHFVISLHDGPCLDGRFHWLNLCWKHPHILCFDLETELFSIYDLPLPFLVAENRRAALYALEDSLCLCDSTSGDGIIIWLAVEVDKSWIKGFVIPKNPNLPYSSFYLLFNTPLSFVKAFNNGDYLMKYNNKFFLYQPHMNTIDDLDWGKQR